MRELGPEGVEEVAGHGLALEEENIIINIIDINVIIIIIIIIITIIIIIIIITFFCFYFYRCLRII